MITIRRIHVVIFLFVLIVLGIITYFYKEELKQTLFVIKSLI